MIPEKLRPILPPALRSARREREARTRPLAPAALKLLDNLVFAGRRRQERGKGGLERRRGNRCRVYSRLVVEVCGVRRDRSRKVGGDRFRGIAPLYIVGPALGVTDPTGSSFVFPRLFFLSEVMREESRSPMTAPSSASKSSESSSSSSHVSPSRSPSIALECDASVSSGMSFSSSGSETDPILSSASDHDSNLSTIERLVL